MARVTLKVVAAHAGVSYQTVSKVLNRQVRVSQETEARIFQAAEALGYRPNHRARSLRAQRSWALGYSWAPAPPDQANPILDQFLQSMLQAAERAGYYLLSFPPGLDRERQLASYRELIDTARVDGFILSNVEYDDPRVRFLLDQDAPFVAFGRSNPDWDFPFVDVDGEAGLRMTTEHLLSKGHRRIAALAWPEGSRVGANRLAGYLAAMMDAGLHPGEEWIARGEGNFEFGRAAARRWFARPPDQRPTAIVALNDPMAIGAMHAAREFGLGPGVDVAITGFDDAPLVQYLSPPLTSLRQPIWQIGQKVIELLVGIVEGTPLEETQILMPPRLVARGSSEGPVQ